MNVDSACGMQGMMQQQPSASKIMSDFDTDGDGSINVEELSALGERGQRLAESDSNGDGVITEDELSSKIAERMESRGDMQPSMSGMQDMSLNAFKDLLTTLTEESEDAEQSASQQIQDYLSELGLSQEETDGFMNLLESQRFDILA